MIVKKFKENIRKLKVRTKELKKNLYVLYLAYKHPKTPWYAKALTALVVAYALSPIDLIPDFIPVLGYLDDLILVPAGITLSLKLIPKDIIEECRQREENEAAFKKQGIAASVVIVILWLFIIYKAAVHFLK